MISGAVFFAVLGILAAVATLVLGTIRVSSARLEQVGTALVSGTRSEALRAAARLCLGLSCLFALAACGELWLSLQGQDSKLDASTPSAQGALWVYVLALLVEWRWFGLPSAGRRAVSGLLLAGVGVLFLGVGLASWSTLHQMTEIACAGGMPAIDPTAPEVNVVAALGLALVPLAGVTLRVINPAGLPLAAGAASVVVAIWLRPVLPSLGWLPLSLGAGAALAALLTLALLILGLAVERGARMTVGGLPAYFVLSVGGYLVLALL